MNREEVNEVWKGMLAKYLRMRRNTMKLMLNHLATGDDIMLVHHALSDAHQRMHEAQCKLEQARLLRGTTPRLPREEEV